MIDKTETSRTPDDPPETRIRRPWHAPRFVVADFSLTQTASNAGMDGGVFPAYTQS
jgi:hypothetical protein